MKNLLQPFFLLISAGLLLPAGLHAQARKLSQFVDATTLTMIGKAFPGVPLYHRLDTSSFEGMSASENQQGRCSAGLAILFRTNSSYIDLIPSYKWKHVKENMTAIAASGFDLYIKQKQQWVYAGTAAAPTKDSVVTIVSGMDTSIKECLLYLPLYSELTALKIGVQTGSSISSVADLFPYKIAFFGSSFTQGTSASRPGMSLPAQIARELKVNVFNLGFAGNAKLQPYFARMIADVEADAIVLDAFSNPTDSIIRERLENFAEIILKKHKRIPLIFIHTLYRGNMNFNLKSRQTEARKEEAAKEIMKTIMRKYTNVYFLENPLNEEVNGDASADGVHPSDLGYQMVARGLSAQLKSILKLKE